jgi:hypothetical protein
MITETRCLICGQETAAGQRGIVAPFLARRVWNRNAFLAEYRHCDGCSFGYFSPRMEPAEEERLYAGYRDQKYVHERHSTEPWYTAKLNNSFDSPDTLEARRKVLQQIFAQHLPGDSKKVLDFGGDRGELIQAVFPRAEKFVYEISGVPPLEGIRSVSLAEGAQIGFDLIICSNVLEHVAYPNQLLHQIDSLAQPDTFVFLEVPIEAPHDARTVAKRLAQEAVLLLMRPSLAISLLKLRSTCVMHEHLNFFSLPALQQLAASIHSWKEIASGRYEPFVATASPTAWVLLRT